jgi:hypothetical protein
MIGKSLRARFELVPLSEERAVSAMNEMLASHARPIVEVRARGERMIACAVVRADKLAVRLCETLGLAMKRGGTAVFGLVGEDAAQLFESLSAERRAWLAEPCEPRTTKVLLVADGGIALLAIEAKDGAVTITPARFEPGA